MVSRNIRCECLTSHSTRTKLLAALIILPISEAIITAYKKLEPDDLAHKAVTEKMSMNIGWEVGPLENDKS